MRVSVECQPAGVRWLLVVRLLPVCVALALMLISLSADTAVCQRVVVRQGAGEDIDKETKAAIVDSVSKALNDVYVFPDVAKKMEKELRRKLKSKTYKEIST